MSRPLDDDATMRDDDTSNHQDSSVALSRGSVKSLTNTQLMELDRKAREHYQIKLCLLKDKVMYKPTLDTIYFNQADTFLSNVPEDLYLEVLLGRYNDLAAQNFCAVQDSDIQDDQLTRLIWYYGLDENHTFNRYFESARFNIISMAYVWACKFDTQYCDPSAKPMLIAFIKAWMSTLEVTDENRNDFTAQDDFIQIWRESEYDLITFTNSQARLIGRLIGQLKERSLPYHVTEKLLDKIDKVLSIRREGRISEEDWEKYGANIVILWTLALKSTGDRQIAAMNARRTQSESINTLQAKMGAERAAKRAKANGESGNVLAQVPWDDNLIVALLKPVDVAARDPKKLAN